jgi:hypothetical protein
LYQSLKLSIGARLRGTFAGTTLAILAGIGERACQRPRFSVSQAGFLRTVCSPVLHETTWSSIAVTACS